MNFSIELIIIEDLKISIDEICNHLPKNQKNIIKILFFNIERKYILNEKNQVYGKS